MSRKFYGYAIAAVGLIGVAFFRNYHGRFIAYPILWYVLCIIFFLSGIYIAQSAKSKKQIDASENETDRTDKLKATGKKIKVNFDDCEFKENNYYEEVANNIPVQAQPLAELIDPNGGYRQEYVALAVLIYFHKAGGKTEKFTSPSYTMNLEALKMHILNSEIFLYVDKFDRTNYFFDIQSQ